MVSRIVNPSEGNTVLLFGPQALSFDQEAFIKLRSTILGSPAYQWVLDVVAELPTAWTILKKKVPEMEAINGEQQLKTLNDCIRTGDITAASFPLSNILLSPLVVITQLTQYAKYLDDHPELQKPESTETLGFCTGILSALAVSSSAGQAEFAKYGAVAVRLAMLIGAVVDTQDTTAKLGPSKSMATAWNTPNGKNELTRILTKFPDVCAITVRLRQTRIADKSRHIYQ